MNKEAIQRVKELLSSANKVGIVSHRNPDGDAYGSSVALGHYLKKIGLNVQVISPNDSPDFLKWLPGQEEIMVFEKETATTEELLKNLDLIFALDFNALHRLGEQMERSMLSLKVPYILIDHHQQPDDFAEVSFVDPTMSSTSEMVYDFIDAMEDLDKIDENIATCLYTGLLTDTGSFRFPATTSKTHRVVADLLDKGANNSEIYNKIHDVNTYDRMQLLSRALRNLTVLKEYRTAFIRLSQYELNQFNFQRGDTEGFVNYALSLKDVVFAAIFIEDRKQKIIKISFRSVGSFSVNEFARNYFNGGGHINAAGGRSNESLHQTIERFVELLPLVKKDLNP